MAQKSCWLSFFGAPPLRRRRRVAAGATAGTWDAVQALGRPDAPSELARSPELAEEVFAFAQRHCGL